MSDSASTSLDRRVLFLAPTVRDAATTRELLAAHAIHAEIFSTVDALIGELDRGAAAILIPEEAVPAAGNQLRRVLAEQPPWSDLPILVLTRPGADSATIGDAVRMLGNVTLLERPLQISTLLSALRSSLRARDRQYQIRTHLAERARAEELLQAADRRKDEFLATLGHELRNPLAPLLTGLQLIKTAGVDNPLVVRMTDVMERQIHHLVRLVDDLLEVSRITRGLIDIQTETLDLAGIVRSAVETCQSIVGAAGHQLTVELPAQRVHVAGDAVRLTQVFANLITNAAKYTNAGGQIWVAMRPAGRRVEVSVRDNGIGIPPSHLDSVFDMFMQVDRSDRRAQGGLGIGLTLVRSLVEMHGGKVAARSAGAGAGSEFVVELPMLAEQTTKAAPRSQLLEFPPRRILLVDDNADAAETMGSLLQLLGATVEVVHSGRDALESLARFDPEVVLLDIGMPEMDGYAAARRIRSSTHAHVLLIALTGWGQGEDQEKARAAGFDHHLVKPPDVEKLREILVAHQPAGLGRDAAGSPGHRPGASARS